MATSSPAYCHEVRLSVHCRESCFELIEKLRPWDVFRCSCAHIKRPTTRDKCDRIQWRIANNTCLGQCSRGGGTQRTRGPPSPWLGSAFRAVGEGTMGHGLPQPCFSQSSRAVSEGEGPTFTLPLPVCLWRTGNQGRRPTLTLPRPVLVFLGRTGTKEQSPALPHSVVGGICTESQNRSGLDINIDTSCVSVPAVTVPYLIYSTKTLASSYAELVSLLASSTTPPSFRRVHTWHQTHIPQGRCTHTYKHTHTHTHTHRMQNHTRNLIHRKVDSEKCVAKQRQVQVDLLGAKVHVGAFDFATTKNKSMSVTCIQLPYSRAFKYPVSIAESTCVDVFTTCDRDTPCRLRLSALMSSCVWDKNAMDCNKQQCRAAIKVTNKNTCQFGSAPP